MLFNSVEFILIFLPVTFFGYFWFNRRRLTRVATAWLAGASLLFYAYWDWAYLPLLAGSVIFNFGFGNWLNRLHEKPVVHERWRTLVLVLGIVANLTLLGYFKYTDFFLRNINRALGSDISLLHLVLPLGISFFTFTQIAYLVDVYRKQTREYDFLNYALFVSYFPHLLAGPILHHKEMIPQFSEMTHRVIRAENLARGLSLFAIGLFKKVIIADSLATYANAGFAATHSLTVFDAWLSSLSYSLQVYFDFSGYTDMAIGMSLMFNIHLPINFNSPYQARNIQDFWRRWHMTLSRFLREYVYIPLGGNRSRVHFNLMATFLIGGFWHGAGWTFIIWGALHGMALVIHREWTRLGYRLPDGWAWVLTLLFLNVTWIFFRAPSVTDALGILGAMAGFGNLDISLSIFSKYDLLMSPTIAACLVMVCKFQNSMWWTREMVPKMRSAVAVSLLLASSFASLGHASEFLYFNF